MIKLETQSNSTQVVLLIKGINKTYVVKLIRCTKKGFFGNLLLRVSKRYERLYVCKTNTFADQVARNHHLTIKHHFNNTDAKLN